ncbi:MAG: indole-3-glycerol-phosphate synthase, partial [Candidatus Altarchaeaceae archaeon]
KNFIKKGKVPVIAEIKRKSPISKSSRNLDIVETAKIFQNYNACGLSILTDKNFDGSLEDLKKIKELKEKGIIEIPVLRKDFIIDEIQIYESFIYGADAILLIANILKEKTKKFLKIARKLNIECIVEIHNEDDINFIYDAKIVGINTRNLKNFEINKEILKISEKIPERNKRIIVGESGIKDLNDAKYALNYCDALLIGTSISENFELLKEIVENRNTSKF